MTDTLRELAQKATSGPWWCDEFMAVMPGLPVLLNAIDTYRAARHE